MKDDILPKIVLFGQPSTAAQEIRSSTVGVGGRKERFKGASQEGVKREILNRLGLRWSARSYTGFRRFVATASS